MPSVPESGPCGITPITPFQSYGSRQCCYNCQKNYGNHRVKLELNNCYHLEALWRSVFRSSQFGILCNGDVGMQIGCGYLPMNLWGMPTGRIAIKGEDGTVLDILGTVCDVGIVFSSLLVCRYGLFSRAFPHQLCTAQTLSSLSRSRSHARQRSELI